MLNTCRTQGFHGQFRPICCPRPAGLSSVADAWYQADSVRVGYEISFTRYFYKPQPIRTLEEIGADILALEKETEGLLGDLPMVREPPAVYGKPRIYLDTSVIGGCMDEEFREPSRRLIEKCARGEVTLVVSSVTLEELEAAPRSVRDVLRSIPLENLERIEVTEEVQNLADRYIESGALAEPMRTDADHIAAATVAGVDTLASWNFRHMVNLWRIRKYGAVNQRMGYLPVDMRSPKELADEEE